ncbi:MAG: hypothetical protein IBJ12_06480 [Sphingomonadaceae bacterium]|nr:hypothetical protein [Sphingomonadaceae bacterium]
MTGVVRGGRKKWLLWSVPVAIIAITLLLWLEWLGSERPLQIKEIPVGIPAEKAGSRIDRQ